MCLSLGGRAFGRGKRLVWSSLMGELVMNRFVSLLSTALAVGLLATGASATTITDDFSTTHDYAAGNVAGTIWSGVVNSGSADALNANSAAAGKLQFNVANNVGFDWDMQNAPFLYVDVAAGDFDARVSVADWAWPGNYPEENSHYACPALVAYVDSDHFVTSQLDAFAWGKTKLRSVYDANGTNEFEDVVNLAGPDVSGAGFSQLRLTRVGSVFHAYARNSTSAISDDTGWIEIDSGVVRTDMTGVVKVGVTYGTYSGFDAITNFDDFQLSTIPEPSTMALTVTGLVGLLAYAWRKQK